MKLEKITEVSEAAPFRRWYKDACGTAHALELIGERWSLLVMREMMFGPRRFGDLKSALPGLSANVLTQRLEALEAHGLVVKTKLPPPASVPVYDLTDWGREADEILMVLGRWAARSPDHDPTLPLSPSSLMLSLRTMFQPPAGGVDLSVNIRLGAERFRLSIGAFGVRAERGETPEALLTFVTTPEAMADFVYGKRALSDLTAEGRMAFSGDPALGRLFQSCFALPEKAPRRPLAAD